MYHRFESYCFQFKLMARQSLLKKNLLQYKLWKKYSLKRSLLQNELQTVKTAEEKMNILEKIQKLPRNSSKTRLSRRCFVTGNSKNVNSSLHVLNLWVLTSVWMAIALHYQKRHYWKCGKRNNRHRHGISHHSLVSLVSTVNGSHF